MNEFTKILQKALPKLEKEIDSVLEKAGILGVKTIRKFQDDNDNYASRRLSNSTNYKVMGKTLTIGANAKNRGYSYGLTQEFGRKKGSFPNLTDLRKWVVRKVKLGHLELNKGLGKNFEKRIDSLTYLIGRAIKEKGVKGRFYYQKGFIEAVKYFNAHIEKRIEAAFE